MAMPGEVGYWKGEVDRCNDQIARLQAALDFVAKLVVKEGECLTLPDGSCVGVNCICVVKEG